jgi:hypothetical protein
MVRLSKIWGILVIFCFIILITGSFAPVYASPILRIGSQGHLVNEVQGYLQQLNYLRQRPNGYYGKITAEAIKSFQLEHALKVDGIVGPETMAAFQMAINDRNQMIEHIVVPNETLATIAEQYNTSIAAIMIKNKLPCDELTEGQKLMIPTGGSLSQIASRGRSGGIKILPWSTVNQLWNIGETATVIDVETGKTFQAKRLYGYYHADVEPLTWRDTETLLSIYGGHWSWSRRAVVIYLRNLFIAASTNGMPHGGKSIVGNGFPGQFCIHFLGSRVHQSGMVDSEHLAMIVRAANYNFQLTNFKDDLEQGNKTNILVNRVPMQ